MVINRKKEKILGILILSGIIFILYLLYKYNPSNEGSFFPPCIFYKTTNLLCSGCGATRAIHELLHFNFYNAFMLNPLFVISLPLIIYYFLSVILRLFFGSYIIYKIPTNVTMGYLSIFIIIFYTMIRNIFNF